MVFRNPFKGLSRFEWLLWSFSIVIVSGSFILSGGFFLLSLIASLVGVTALIFVAKGDVWGQLLTVFFSLLYAVVSFKFRYYGEMITYLGMTAPIAVLSVISWLKHPYSGTTEVKVHHLAKGQRKQIVLITLVVTFVFYFILAYFNTANLLISTLSVATSFSASFLMLYRSPIYALAFGVNDLVLIVMWILASMDDLSYLPMVACFIMFLLNDIYGFFNWVRMKKRQQA
ncbi:MAG: nicotinamide mononucleotide transporter PnuC [Fusobacteria bacterium]|nr:MAG: nicotinamide mononucleotide transporter PnuC [Fusobacteriota bacterium]KAF0228586.1 MAG: nicotinamide mononucleotide transporter [Fusobacteriota bacterium]